MTRPVDEERLIAFLDGELPPHEAAEVSQALDADPRLAELADRHRALRSAVSEAYEPAAREPVPEVLLDLVRRAPPAAEAGAGAAEVVGLDAARARRREAAEEKARAARVAARGGPMAGPNARRAAALAACVAIGVALGMFWSRPAPTLLGEDLTARGALHRTLERGLASEPDARAPIRIGLTFRDREGAWCRTFAAPAMTGVACREAGAWRVRAAAADPSDAPGEFRQARSAAAPLVLEAVDAMIAGEPVDAQGETAARDGGWR